jgi:putative flippase GtrA
VVEFAADRHLDGQGHKTQSGRGTLTEGTEAPPGRVGRLLADQRARFLLVGGTNTVIGYAVFAVFDLTLFADVPHGHLLSLIPAYAISIVIAFFLYRRFVFHVSGRAGRDFLAFVSVNLVSIGLNLVLLAVLVSVFAIPTLVAQAFALMVTVLVTYFGHREVSFGR